MVSGAPAARASCTASGRLHAGGALLDRTTAACAWSRWTFASPRLLAIFELLAFKRRSTAHDLSRARARGSGQFGLPRCPPLPVFPASSRIGYAKTSQLSR